MRLTSVPVDDQPDKDGSVRHSPESMAAGKGIGCGAITYLQGREDVLPKLLEMIQGASKDLAWTKDWTAADVAYAQAQLTPRFTKEGMTAHANMVFQPGGIRFEFFRPARSGWEVITVTVAATHGRKTSALGRVDRATLEVMPSAFAGQSGDDTAGSAINFNARLNATVGITPRKQPRRVGFLLQGAWARSVSETTTAGATGFSLQAMLYEGLARLFTSDDVEYHLSASIRHEHNISPGVAQWAGHKVADVVKTVVKSAAHAMSPPQPATAAAPADAAADGAAAADSARATRAATLKGAGAFILHDRLARANPVDDAVLDKVGRTRVLARFG